MTSGQVRLTQPRSFLNTFLALAAYCVFVPILHSAPTPVQDLAQFRRLSDQEIALRPPVKLRATVTYYAPEHFRLYIQDGNIATYAYPDAGDPQNPNRVFLARRGDLVEFTGVAISGELSPIIVFSKYEIISHNHLPPPAHFSLHQMDLPDSECRRARFAGRVLSAYRIASDHVEDPGGGLALVVGNPQQKLDVTIDYPAGLEPNALIGADLEFTGIVAHTAQRGQFLGSVFEIQEAADIHILSAPNTDPYSIPIVKVQNLLRYGKLDWDRAVHVQGVVTHRSRNDSFFIQDETQGLLVETLNPVALQPGDLVNVVGYPSPGPYSPILRYSLFRKTQTGLPVNPIRITSLDIPDNYSKDYASSWLAHDGKLVEIEAELLGQRILSKEVTFLLRAGKAVFSAKSDERGSFAAEIEPGSILKLRGICTVAVTGSHHRPEHMELILNSSSDVTVLRNPPWWTGKHLIVVLVVSLICFILLASWSFTLRSQVRAKTAELHERATRDGLTRTWNRTEILGMLDRELASAQRRGSDVTIVLLDLDHFKLINDRYGHQAGDAVLVEACCRLGRNLRSTDAIGRYGGEEFLIVLPQLNSAADHARIEELRIAVAAQPVFHRESAIPITCSLGVTCSTGGTAPSDLLIKAADVALYRAKRSGRNRVEFETPGNGTADCTEESLAALCRFETQDAA